MGRVAARRAMHLMERVKTCVAILERVYDLLTPRQWLCGRGCKTQDLSNSRAIARICAAGQATPQTAPALAAAKSLSHRVRAKSGDFCALALACTPVQAASHHFELIPIALQRGCVEIANTFLGPPAEDRLISHERTPCYWIVCYRFSLILANGRPP